ncbi:MAG: putative lipoic acid-binding regulatory protein [Cryomorphaceae bacterium]|jgi:putative lipoic acid-binding regulatory protein
MSSPIDPKDGFDFIEYPCDYMFKVMCRVQPGQVASNFVRDVIVSKVGASALLVIKTNASRTGKFESVSANVRLNSRQELESIYQSIASLPSVVMTL